ncbi:thiolase family protein [Clostridium transplantifaecale]|uniref:thiolase family protein n=1 Tax=Clostridium transplantifaecale TaxID=2479838 RepID=UPI000F63DCF3|nr:thiolase family protein [Clostridium transplantifaecale]
MTRKNAVYITHGVRTAIGKIGRSLKDVSDTDLAMIVIKNLLEERAKLDFQEIDQVIFGEVKQKSDSANVARAAALLAGIPEKVPAYTVNRQCGSGLQAVIDAFEMIETGEADVIVAGGVENMSQSVYYMRNAKEGLKNGDFSIEDSLTAGGPGAVPIEKYGVWPMGMTAEKLAELYHITREQQDAFAMNSQIKMHHAMEDGRFKEQIVPVPVIDNGHETLFSTDEHPFLSSMEKLAALKPAFKKDGTVTAGNSSGRNDGASAVLVMSEDKMKEFGYKPMAKIISVGSSGCDPTVMGLGPVESSILAMKRAGLTLHDLDIIELNEAFAAQSIAVMKEWEKLGISEEALLSKINPNGGAIAHGHALGNTGAALTVKCMYEMQRRETARYGMITMCCAGGVGVAAIIEKC